MKRSSIETILKFGLLPIGFYLICFVLLTYPAILKFNTHFFCDSGDGLQNVWNIWWVNKSVSDLGTTPWFTNYLHYPYGVSLLGQTLNPFNGFMGIVLLKFLSILQTHNFIIVFSFVTAGTTTFLLAHYITKSYFASLVAGYIFTFSSYHFAHAQGHMQLVSLEWIPLFLLFFILLMSRPSVLMAASSSIALFGVILCDYYYFLFCILSGIIIVISQMIKKRQLLLIFTIEYRRPITLFISFVLLTSGTLVFKLLLLNKVDPLLGAHNALIYSTDLLAAVIPGGHWRFSFLSEGYWSKLPGNIHESSVYVGIIVIGLIIYSLTKKEIALMKNIKIFYFILFFFFILSLGPSLHIAGQDINLSMPYALFEKLLPFITISGCPVRMMVMVMLSASVICAAALMNIGKLKRAYRLPLISAILLILFIEYLPGSLPLTHIKIPQYVHDLKEIKTNKGIVDFTSNSDTRKLYFQTIHEKPMAFGYISRTPVSITQKDKKLMKTIQNRQIEKLYSEYNIKFLIGGKKGNETIFQIDKQ